MSQPLVFRASARNDPPSQAAFAVSAVINRATLYGRGPSSACFAGISFLPVTRMLKRPIVCPQGVQSKSSHLCEFLVAFLVLTSVLTLLTLSRAVQRSLKMETKCSGPDARDQGLCGNAADEQDDHGMLAHGSTSTCRANYATSHLFVDAWMASRGRSRSTVVASSSVISSNKVE